MDKIKIATECGACNGTGLYQGCAEKKGYPVVCVQCDGSGGFVLTLKPYQGRRTKRGVKGVGYNSTGTILTAQATTDYLTYSEFKEHVPELLEGVDY